MKAFQIEKVNDTEYSVIVMSTSYINPIDEIEDIEEYLRKNFKGKVLFDMLLKNGISSNRFIEAIFDGEKFDLQSFRALSKVDDRIREFAANFYRCHEEFLNNSTLPKAYQFLIKKGKLI
ncbi:MAG: hypothetical protein K0R93_1005 [Anaerosolibacter sp.]|jgi:hypothetical protein|uniref:type II toxin-antitoxin system RnlB family antitoxin n=1 Tax=Anaerosolibacter sp. TaxID=1872527 RepID=UPI002629C78A|nr:type II toxin-antitoxin system RnlB family antitoxin [Anaerosolibacter sp.]MDF2546107.1 hypothetical protein [Anaerosolibacter sp.]